jgi:hypothetical protein
MYGICGVSANNIYIYGQNSAANDLGSNLLHYDGTSWQYIKIHDKVIYGNINGMYVSSQNEIWCAADGLGISIFKYDGLSWYNCWPSGEISGALLCIAGNKSDNIYAAGRNGVVLQYTGGSWRVDRIKMNVPSGAEYFIRSAAVCKDTCYMLGYISDIQNYQNKHYFIKGTYKNWTVVDSVIEKGITNWKWGWWGLYTTPDNKLLSFGANGICEYTAGAWTKLPLGNQWLISSVFSLNSNYTIAVGHYGTAYFNDGNSWKKLEKFEKGYENIVYTGVWGDGKELFVIGYTANADPIKTLVFHGK